jgi:hypothetical protein
VKHHLERPDEFSCRAQGVQPAESAWALLPDRRPQQQPGRRSRVGMKTKLRAWVDRQRSAPVSLPLRAMKARTTPTLHFYRTVIADRESRE